MNKWQQLSIARCALILLTQLSVLIMPGCLMMKNMNKTPVSITNATICQSQLHPESSKEYESMQIICSNRPQLLGL